MTDSERKKRDSLLATLAHGRTRFLLQAGVFLGLFVWMSLVIVNYFLFHKVVSLEKWFVILFVMLSVSTVNALFLWNRMRVKSRDYPS